MRIRRVVAGVLLPVYLSGCATWKTQQVSPQQVVSQEQPDRMLVTLSSGEEIVVDQPRVSADTLSGLRDGVPMEIPLAEVTGVATRGVHAAKTTGLMVGVVLGLAVVAGTALLCALAASDGGLFGASPSTPNPPGYY